MSEVTVRQARPDDRDAVAAFTQGTWADRGVDDYLPDVFPEWVESDDEEQRTFVVDVDGDVGGICQGVLLTDYEGWAQGMRVAPEYRGRGFARRLTDRLFEWARDRGATVVRNMVFSWNAAGLGESRASGFEPATEGRWAQPEPDPEAEPDRRVTGDPDAAWSFWQRSEARDLLGGLTVDPSESWSFSTLTRERLHDLADETRVIAVRDERGTCATTARVRTWEHGTETQAIYGHSAWRDVDAARALFDAVAADAAELGVDGTRVLLPETCRHVSDVAAVRANPSDEPFFVLERDLTGLDSP